MSYGISLSDTLSPWSLQHPVNKHRVYFQLVVQMITKRYMQNSQRCHNYCASCGVKYDIKTYLWYLCYSFIAYCGNVLGNVECITLCYTLLAIRTYTYNVYSCTASCTIVQNSSLVIPVGSKVLCVHVQL